ncbi:glycerophosphodiester phosphodiesterase [Leifsonia sp. NPDC058248]|uniref:glycerophosphodiester phosphodiesterase n=1 Tax=Leifsonia sp. NPDC058248 TaxID=3346402 RepID=UPI0036DE7C9D
MTTLTSAHRGDSSEFRENTLPAIRSAIEKGADFVEIDVRLTADGDVVALHDPTLRRLWGIDASIDTVPTADLLAIGDADHRPPLLSEVVPLFAAASSVLLIDMDDVAFAAPALDVARRFDVPVAWCGHIAAMRLLRALDPSAQVWLPWSALRPPTPAELADLRPSTVNAPFAAVTSRLADAVHEAGYTVTAWTIDDPELMERAVQIGVDAITTNRLSLLQGVLRTEAAR